MFRKNKFVLCAVYLYGVNKMNNASKGKIKMAILTAKCDRPLVVASDKAEEFLSQKNNPVKAKKVAALAKKIEVNPNTTIQFGKPND